MSTYTGALTSDGLPELADEGTIDFPAMTLRRALHVTLRDDAGNPVGGSGGPIDVVVVEDAGPGSSVDNPVFIAQPDGSRLRLRPDGGYIDRIDRATAVPPAPLIVPFSMKSDIGSADIYSPIVPLSDGRKTVTVRIDQPALPTGIGGQATFEVSPDDGRYWAPVYMTGPPPDGGIAVSVTTTGTWFMNAGAYTHFRIHFNGSVNMSGTIVVSAGAPADSYLIIRSSDNGTVAADVFDLAQRNPLAVAITDGTGAQITSFAASNVQYTEGDIDSTITGTAAMFEDENDMLRVASANHRLPVIDDILRRFAELEYVNDPPYPNIVNVEGTVPTWAKGSTIGSSYRAIVSTTAVRLLPVSVSRLAALIVNNGPGNLYLDTASTVTASGASSGWILGPGGCYSDAGDGVSYGELWGIYDRTSTTQNVIVSDRG